MAIEQTRVIALTITSLVASPDVQSRAGGIVSTVVAEYAKAIENGDQFPPIDVFYDESQYIVADGFHRLEAHKKAEKAYISCRVFKGNVRDAILHSIGTNTKHGLRRRNVDKRRAVEMLLRDEEWSKRSDNWICQQAGVTHRAVEAVRKYLGLQRSDKILGRDGRTTKRDRNGAPTGSGSGNSVRANRPENVQALIEISKDNVTLIEACNRLETHPEIVLQLAELAARQGHEIHFAPGRDERVEFRLRTQLREANEAKKHLLSQLESRDVQVENLTALHSAPVEPIVARRGIGEGMRRQGTPVLVMSDLHIEEKVTTEKTMGLNEYNPEIAKRCIERCAEAFEWFEKEKKSHWDMRTAIVAIIGDTFSGWIHAELVESNFMSPVRAAAWLQDELERALRTMLNTTNFEKIIVVFKDGNHGRLTQKIRCSTRTENSLEWFMFHTLAQRLKDEPRLQFQIDDSIYSYLDIYGRTLALTHGDQFQYMGGVGGLLIPVRRGLNEARKYRPVDTFVMGHFHTYMPLDDVHVNGSAIGVTPYSLSKSIPPERRRQSWFLLDSANWKTENAPVWLVKEPEPAWKALPPQE